MVKIINDDNNNITTLLYILQSMSLTQFIGPSHNTGRGNTYYSWSLKGCSLHLKIQGWWRNCYAKYRPLEVALGWWHKGPCLCESPPRALPSPISLSCQHRPPPHTHTLQPRPCNKGGPGLDKVLMLWARRIASSISIKTQGPP